MSGEGEIYLEMSQQAQCAKRFMVVYEQSIRSCGVVYRGKPGDQATICQLCAVFVNCSGICILHRKVSSL